MRHMLRLLLLVAVAVCASMGPTPANAHKEWNWIAEGDWRNEVENKGCCTPDNCHAGEILGWRCVTENDARVCFVTMQMKEGPFAGKDPVRIRVDESGFHRYSEDRDRVCHLDQAMDATKYFSHYGTCVFRIPRIGEKPDSPPNGRPMQTKWHHN